ncbi:hypothetical protein [Rhizobium sp. Leaf453]|uniref:DUF7878 domain-containing protein n=2 Tax=unclassified Rhizobium TaxID=2613769 RepID=UPI000712DB71|nr:hypothetical protein [Rhizobium sp. Leaf453]KQT05487.1 hypothetical protein ASG50_15225 [Rhizobium sp. Leaf386]KQU06040.1 hypothetical protein ASG68_25225 [Rhizobium sp. Leaf453]
MTNDLGAYQRKQGSMMDFGFEIVAISKQRKGYRVVTDTSGKLRVTFAHDRFFLFEEILIVEFALYCFDWQCEYGRDPTASFYYASMDEEEEPLLAFTLQLDGLWTAESGWAEFTNPGISNEELSKAVSDFLLNFESFTKSAFGFGMKSLASELKRSL